MIEAPLVEYRTRLIVFAIHNGYPIVGCPFFCAQVKMIEMPPLRRGLRALADYVEPRRLKAANAN